MFSGIVETTSQVQSNTPQSGIRHLTLSRPVEFQDLHIGDSISVNGVCLTVETLLPGQIQFALGPETLQVTGWDLLPTGASMNVERSLRLGDRIHGHLVSGHVDAMVKVLSTKSVGESQILELEIPTVLRPYFWKKGSVAINGVSLTLNEVAEGSLSVCLIPETLRRTNLGSLKVGDRVCLEVDQIARGIVESREKLLEARS